MRVHFKRLRTNSLKMGMTFAKTLKEAKTLKVYSKKMEDYDNKQYSIGMLVGRENFKASVTRKTVYPLWLQHR